MLATHPVIRRIIRPARQALRHECQKAGQAQKKTQGKWSLFIEYRLQGSDILTVTFRAACRAYCTNFTSLAIHHL